MDAVLTAMVEDKIGPGEQAKFLVQTAREKIRFDYCLALRSPVIALHLALQSLGLERGQGVVVSALSPFYYERVIRDLGLQPLYCDVPSSTACLTREAVEKALASRPEGVDPRCVVLHHTLGYAGDAAGIAALGLPVIEDCSHSYGTYIQPPGGEEPPRELAAGVSAGIAAGSAAKSALENPAESPDESPPAGVPTGSAGVFTILGLEERDMLTCGGGALLYACNRRDAAVLRNLETLPPEYGLPDMNAALAVVQFREAAKNISKRREIARLYTQSALRNRHKRFIQSDIDHNSYAFPLILETGVKDVKAYARKKDIAVENAFDNTLAGSGIVPPDQCPEAYSLSLRTVLFPLYPRLKISDAERIARLILTLP